MHLQKVSAYVSLLAEQDDIGRKFEPNSAMFWKTGAQRFPKLQNFRSVLIQSICRRKNKCDQKIEICVRKGRKHNGKRRKMLVTSIFSFSLNVPKGLFPRGAKSRDGVVKS